MESWDDYTTVRPDLAEALAELNEAGYDVHYWLTTGGAVPAEGVAPSQEYAVRIVRGPERFDGTGPSEDVAFEAALARFETQGT